MAQVKILLTPTFIYFLHATINLLVRHKFESQHIHTSSLEQSESNIYSTGGYFIFVFESGSECNKCIKVSFDSPKF